MSSSVVLFVESVGVVLHRHLSVFGHSLLLSMSQVFSELGIVLALEVCIIFAHLVLSALGVFALLTMLFDVVFAFFASFLVGFLGNLLVAELVDCHLVELIDMGFGILLLTLFGLYVVLEGSRHASCSRVRGLSSCEQRARGHSKSFLVTHDRVPTIELLSLVGVERHFIVVISWLLALSFIWCQKVRHVESLLSLPLT